MANCPNPYFCRYKEGYQHIYPNKQYHNSSRMSNKVYVDKLRINHYWTRDRDFFNRVRLKRCAFLCEDSPLPAEVAAELNAVEDKAIFKYVYALHTVIFLEKILKEIANGETE